MNLLLVNPPSPFLLDEKVFPPLGIMKVAADFDAPILDLAGEKDYLETLSVELDLAGGYTHVGVGATTPQLPFAVEIARRVREISPAKVILGGSHATVASGGPRPDKSLPELFDHVIADDGAPGLWKLAGGPVNGTVPKPNMDWGRDRIDILGYKYEIEGHPATSLISQFGCLAAGTKILLATGEEVPIEKISVGDEVQCLDESSGGIITGPVAQAWSREANDLWELKCDDGTTIKVTSEHPIWTQQGWREVASLLPGEEIGFLREMRDGHFQGLSDVPTLSQGPGGSGMPPVRQEIRVEPGVCAGEELLLLRVQGRVAENTGQSGLAAGGAGGCEEEVAGNDAGRAGKGFEHRGSEKGGEDPKSTPPHFGIKEGGQEPHEEAGGRRKSLPDNQGKMGAVFLGADEGDMEGRPNETGLGLRRDNAIAQQTRADVGGNISDGGAVVSVCGEQRFLDRSVSVRETPEPGFYKQEGKECNSAPRRVLAHAGTGGSANDRLSKKGLGGAHHLGQGTAHETTSGTPGQAGDILFRRIVSKRFIGRSRVYNLTVCPGHSYIANGIIVHNCPFACGFCSGRAIPFYRHVKYRTHADVISEIRMLHLVYGFTGFMFYDDEMNVNPKMIEFMGMLEALQNELGVEFRFRGFVKAGIFTQEHATAMYRAGFRWLLCGFEGADPKLLLNINKKATVDDNTEMVEFAKTAGMKVKALMSIGHPGESPASVRAVEDWLLAVEPEDFDCTVITPYPGAPYYDKAVKQGDVWRYEIYGDALYMDEIDYTVTSDFYKGMQGAYISHVYTDHLSKTEIVAARDSIESNVRGRLGIPYPGMNQFEHSMGQQ